MGHDRSLSTSEATDAFAPRDTGPSRGTWSIARIVALGLVVLVGVALRALLWPTPGHVLDIDQFVKWVGYIAVHGFDHAYDQEVCYPPVMVFVWWVLGATDPAFRTAVDSSDLTLRVLMKVPASLADVGIALAVAYWYRKVPAAAVAAAAVILFTPAIWYASAWWGQYESIYVLPAVLAVLAARADRPGLAAVLLAASLMAKPQALPFLVPFAGWVLAVHGWTGALRASTAFAVTCLALWLPFLGDNGPSVYVENVQEWQNGVLGVASMNAWNPWWLVQSAEQRYISDATTVLGPLTMRHLGLGAAFVVTLPVLFGVYRRPTAEHLAIGLAAATLVAFTMLTTMHERYAYAAIPFLLLACRAPAVRIVCAALAAVVSLNQLVIRPPDVQIPGFDQVGVIGPVAMLAITGLVVLWTWQGPPGDPVASLPSGTREGRAAATVGA